LAPPTQGPASLAVIATANTAKDEDWPGWLGATRTAEVAWLPERLDPPPRIVWRQPLQEVGLGGVAVVRPWVLVSDRESGDTGDVFRCLHADSGKEAWALRYAARGKLDYGNSPRATPLVDGDRVYLAGAHGHVHAVELRTGKVLWQKNLGTEFSLKAALKWGYCASPLLVDDKLILYPGGADAAIIAVEPATGKILWKSAGRPPAYGSLVAGKLGGLVQIVGHDAEQLTGWDAATGRELWSVEPNLPGDFNVPTPRIVKGQLLVATEGNGARLFAFGENGRIDPKPAATFPQLAPGTHTPIVSERRVFGVHDALYCLDLANGLKPIWRGRDKAFQSHTSLIVGSGRLLVITGEAELILVDARADEYRVLGRHRVLADESGILAHPALVGTRLYVRGTREIVCVELAGTKESR